MTMWEILRGLEYLHDNDIVHGGLVLDKILLRNNKVDSNTIVKIALKCCPHISNSTVNKLKLLLPYFSETLK